MSYPLAALVLSVASALIATRFYTSSLDAAKATFKGTKLKWAQFHTHGSSSAESFNKTLAGAEGKAQRYKYALLEERRQIRLLKVICDGSPKRFRCELICVSLDHLTVPYIAVSYTWGDPATKSTISCGRQVLGLTRSVTVILNTLFEEGESLFLWIDALCIDQSNLKEKSHQVRLMKDIFQSAQQVVICLGEQTIDSNIAMDFISPLKKALQDRRDDRSLISLESVCNKCGTGFPSPTWTALGRLLRRPWFNRIWDIQDVAVASKQVFICRDRGVDWDSLIYVTAKIAEHGLTMLVIVDHEDPSKPQFPPNGVVNSVVMHEARCVKQQAESESFQEALMGCYHFAATDPRDKVYALLGIATDSEDAMLDPDYRASDHEVFIKTTRHLLLRDPSIVILHKAGIGFSRALDGLPCWVPDWSSENITMSFGSMFRTAGYHAAGNSIPRVQAASNSHALIIDGMLVDVVTQIGSLRTTAPFDGDSEDVQNYRAHTLAWVHESENMVKSLQPHGGDRPGVGNPSSYRSRESWNEAHWRTLVADTTPGAPAPSDYGEYYRSWHSLILLSQGRNPPPALKNPVLGKQAELFDAACTNSTAQRRFFTTRIGFMGLTSPGTRVDDLVCIFLGGCTPFILRENVPIKVEGSTYTLVGEAYVHRLMSGEGLDVGEVQEIVLT